MSDPEKNGISGLLKQMNGVVDSSILCAELFRTYEKIVVDAYKKVKSAMLVIEDYQDGSGDIINGANAIMEIFPGVDLATVDFAKVIRGADSIGYFHFHEASDYDLENCKYYYDVFFKPFLERLIAETDSKYTVEELKVKLIKLSTELMDAVANDLRSSLHS